jgi:hypothetical protein
MSFEKLADELRACGIAAKVWNDGKIFIDGYGRQLKISVTPSEGGSRPLDMAVIHVTSTWKSTKAALYCKGAKHALLGDLYLAGFISAPPPDDWRKVVLDERPPLRVITRHFEEDAPDSFEITY